MRFVYSFQSKREGANWEAMESELYQGTENGETTQSNVTPLTLAPYSAAEANVLALRRCRYRGEMQVRIEVEDLFGRRYRVEVTAKSGS
jgi:hypothetical protein